MSKRLPAKEYPADMGAWPNPNNKDLDCGLCGAKEGEPHAPGMSGGYCRGTVRNQDGGLIRGPLPNRHVGSMRLMFEEGRRKAIEREKRFWDALGVIL